MPTTLNTYISSSLTSNTSPDQLTVHTPSILAAKNPSPLTIPTITLSPTRYTTYYYYPKASGVSIGPLYDRVTVTRPEHRTSQTSTPVSTPTLSYATSATTSPPRTPTMPGRSVPRVGFAQSISAIRPPREDELSVMRHFSYHADRCDDCDDPYKVWKEGGVLCNRGHGLARDVVKYLYSKGGKPYSIIDKDRTGDRVEVEVPVDCDQVRGLIKAFDKGLSLKRRSAVVSHDRNYNIPDRRDRAYESDDNVRVVLRPAGRSERRERDRYYDDERRERRRTVYLDGYRGSLYERDEEERRIRRDEEPVILWAEPRARRRQN